MRKLDVKAETREGWIVQVYGRDRRLLFVLEPSHGWIFLIGCGLGVISAIILVNLSPHHPPSNSTDPVNVPQFQID